MPRKTGIRQCDTCSEAYEYKSKRSMYCSKACKQVAYLKRNGKPFPEVFRPVVERLSKPKPKPNVGHSALSFQPKGTFDKVDSDIQYWKNVITNAQSGFITGDTLLWALGGAVAGAMVAGKNNQGTGAAVGAAIAGMYGSNIAKVKKDEIIKNAYKKIKELESNRALIAQLSTIQLPQRNAKTIGDIASSSDYKRLHVEEYYMKNSKWGYLWGNPSKPFMAMAYGLPGQGKSTFAVSFANYFQKEFGKVLYFASEQGGINKAFQSLLRDTNATFDTHTKARGLSAKDVAEVAKKGSYSLIVIDSANHMGLSSGDIEKIRELNPEMSVFVILQAVKDGDFRGDNDWAHNSDIVVELRGMKAYQKKSRFSAPSEVEILRN